MQSDLKAGGALVTDQRPHYERTRPSRRTRRLTFRSSGGSVELVAQQRLDMICPPAVGEPPKAGTHGGYWVELHDDAGEVTFFRLVQDPFGTSVELHSPDGVIRREFAPPQETTFEVLVPDDPEATTAVLLGEPPAAPGRAGPSRRKGAVGGAAGSQELARFDLTVEGGEG